MNEGKEGPPAENGGGTIDETLNFAVRGVRSKVVFWIVTAAVLVIAAITWLIFFARGELIRSVPRLKRAWIVSSVEGTDLADDQPKLVDDGRGVMLHIVAYGYDSVAGEYYYYLNSPEPKLPRVIIGGEEIPQNRLRRFEFPNTLSSVSWYKIEVSPFFFRDGSKPFHERLFWTDSRKHRMGNGWWAIADVRADLFAKYHYDFVGTMRFTAGLKVILARGSGEEPLADLTTEGSQPQTPGAIPPGAHRITFIPRNRSGLDATYRAFFNLLAYQDRLQGPSASESTGEFKGGDSRSILIGAINLLGYEALYDDRLFLEKVANRILDGVTADEVSGPSGISFFRNPDNPTLPIPVGKDGIQPGDIIVQGNRYTVFAGEGSSARPQGGAFTNDDRVLDAFNNMVMEAYASVLELKDLPIQVWRLRPLEEIAANEERPPRAD